MTEQLPSSASNPMYWREPEQKERDCKIFAEELDDFVPGKVLDFHVHTFNEAGTHFGKTPSNYGGQTLNAYLVEDFFKDQATAFPGRELKLVHFGLVQPQYDIPPVNAYNEQSDPSRCFPLRVFDPRNDTPEGVDADLARGKFHGLKPYPNLGNPENVNEATIEQMLPDWVMEIANARKSIIMLHIPRLRRLEDPLNQEQLDRLCSRWPQARIVMAHVGRAYYLQNVIGNLEVVKKHDNLYIDTSMVNHWEVLAYAFKELPNEKILYGSDAPIAFAPGKSVEINNQYSYVSPLKWRIAIQDTAGRIQFTTYLNEQLRAIRKAVEANGLGSDWVENYFWNNGMRLLGKA